MDKDFLVAMFLFCFGLFQTLKPLDKFLALCLLRFHMLMFVVLCFLYLLQKSLERQSK